MSLSGHPVGPVLAVSDLQRAIDFYERKLGLLPREGGPNEMRTYEVGGGTALSVYLSPEHAGKATATQVGWSVPDLESTVAELAAQGVTFEQYDDLPLVTDERGIVSFDEGTKVAFFRDPDGNTHALNQGMD